MRYMRKTAGYIWSDYKTNTEITNELKITPVLQKIQNYKTEWLEHVDRMASDRLPKIMKSYNPIRKLNSRRLRWTGHVTSHGAIRNAYRV